MTHLEIQPVTKALVSRDTWANIRNEVISTVVEMVGLETEVLNFTPQHLRQWCSGCCAGGVMRRPLGPCTNHLTEPSRRLHCVVSAQFVSHPLPCSISVVVMHTGDWSLSLHEVYTEHLGKQCVRNMFKSTELDNKPYWPIQFAGWILVGGGWIT